MYIIGQVVGGALIVFVLAWLVERLLISRVMNHPRTGALVSACVAYLIAVILYGFGSANGGSWNPYGLVAYLPGLLIVATYLVWSRRDSEPDTL